MNRSRPWAASDFPYKVDYNDHFETPLVAYQDIAPLLDWLAGSAKTTRTDIRIYDPYYCNGQTQALFRQLGFEGIINRKRDFYQDIEQQTLPEFDILVTNPPYSDQHKQQCLDFALDQLRTAGKPFFLLMPSYVASREYFRTREQGDVLFMIPAEPYEYTHPEGTGKELPPFASLWFCGIPAKEKRQQLMRYWETLSWDNNANGQAKPSLVLSLDDLKETGTISTQKRPNPRQRKKRRQHSKARSLITDLVEGNGNRDTKLPSEPAALITSNDNPQPKKLKNNKSKHRDESGQRKRKRF
jgi:hypothetical protein